MAKTTTGKALVIVESPAKAKTINRYLGSDYEVKASMGHVRDLPSKGINIDIENGFAPTYAVMPGKGRTVTALKAAAKKCDTLYLATDLDREGEAIAWHLSQLLGIPQENTYRVIFNAITKTAIRAAFENPGKLDMDKVMAQQARRVLDRIVGYQISPLLWKKVARGLSAGRVQSVAVKLVVEREREIRAFVPKEYWLVPAVFTADAANDYTTDWQQFTKTEPDEKNGGPTVARQMEWLSAHNAFEADICQLGDEKIETLDGDKAAQVYDALKIAAWQIGDIQRKESSSKAAPPFITSTLQQAAANRMSFTTKRTMIVAQQLYEGIDLGGLGSLGLITYMRTDSTHISGEAITDVRTYIGEKFGENYLPASPLFYSASKSAQQAHEAIRPTDCNLEPDKIKKHLTDEQYKLYDLIWRRFLASQMQPAKWDVTTLIIKAETPLGQCLYRTSGRVMLFDGFTRVWPSSSNQQQLPDVKIGDAIGVVDINAQQHFTKPPARYNEASLVKTLEKEGIGRPSTYATIISTIQDRGYVEQNDRKFFATDLGEVVTDKLNDYFPKIMDVAFTRYMEQQLDRIEEQHLDWVKVLEEFYGPFKQNLETASTEMTHARAETQPSEYTCPDCKEAMVYRFGKNGRFLSCSKYPDCKYACPCDREGKMIEEKLSEHKCPNCDKPMIEKSGRFGKFLGCSDYPTCKTILGLDKQGNIKEPKPPAEPTGIKCYKCKTGELVIRQSGRGPFLGCNKFPRCRTIISVKVQEKLKELQEQGKWPPATNEAADEILGRKKTTKGKKAE